MPSQVKSEVFQVARTKLLKIKAKLVKPRSLPPLQPPVTTTDAYWRGYQDAANKKPERKNPYHASTPLWHSWRKGWLDFRNGD